MMTPWYPQQLRRHPGYAGLKGFISCFSYMEIRGMTWKGSDVVHIRTLIPWHILIPNDNFHALEKIQAAVTQRLAAAHSPALACCKELDYCPSRPKRIWLLPFVLKYGHLHQIQIMWTRCRNALLRVFPFGCNQKHFFHRLWVPNSMCPATGQTLILLGIVCKRGVFFFSKTVLWYLTCMINYHHISGDEHIKQWLLIWRSIPLISTESTIWTLHGQQSAVHSSSSKCGRNFPQNSLVLALVCFFRFCSSLWVLKSKLYSLLGIRARLGHPKYMFQRYSRDWLGLWLPGAPFGNFWLSLGYRFDYR